MWSARQTWKMGRRAAGFLGGLLATILLVAAPAAAAFVDPINLSNSSAAISGRPGIAVNGAGQVFAVWEEGTDIFFTRSNPTQGSCGGLKFEAPRILSTGTGITRLPMVASDGSHGVFVVWQVSSQGSSDVYFRRSTDDGQTFIPPVDQPPVNLSQTTSPSNAPSVAADDLGGVFVAWSEGSFPTEIFFARSTNSGVAFGPAANLSGTLSTNSVAPSVAAGGGNVYLAWQEGPSISSTILYKKFGRLDDLTAVADPASNRTLSAGVISPFGVSGPNLAFGDGILSVAFGAFNAVYHRSSSDGINFSPPRDLAPENLSGVVPFASNARGARRNGSAMVAWAERLDLTTDNLDLRHRMLGATTSPEPVLTKAARRVSPAAAIDSTGRLLVAWQGRETADLPQDEIYLSYKGGTAGDEPNAWVEMTPQTLNAKTIEKGVGVFTLRIGFLDGSAVNYLDSLVLNGNPVTLLRSSLVDTDGNGSPDTLELKIERSKLQPVLAGATLTAAQRNGNDPVNYTVKGNMTGGSCFSSRPGEVRIIHQ